MSLFSGLNNLEDITVNPNYSSLCGYTQEDLETVFADQSRLLDALLANDLDQLEVIFQAFFASIPHDWYRKNQLAGYEGYYASIVYCYFAALGLDVQPEESVSKGRIDLVVRFRHRVYVIEFKVVEQADAGKALEQIKAQGYADKFASQETYLIGVEFSSHERNVVGFAWEAA